MKYWLTKLTHWSALLELAYFFMAAFTTYRAVFGSESKADGVGSDTPWFVSTTWFLFSFVPTISLTVMCLYWLLVYDPSNTIEWLSVVMHGGNFVLVMLDLLIFRQPFYFTHIYVSVLLSAVYALFTLLYYFAGGTFEDNTSHYIYKAVDWTDASGAASLLTLVVLVAVPALYALVFCLCGRPCWKAGPAGEPKEAGGGSAAGGAGVMPASV